MIEAEEAPAAAVDLRSATLRGVRWFGAARVSSEAMMLASSVVLARLLPPAAFGEAALPTAIVAIATALTVQGVATPLVQMRDVTREDLRTAWSLSIGSGLALTVLSFLLAPVLVTPIFGHAISSLFRLSSPVWLLAGLAAVPQALLERRLDFRLISVVAVASMVGSTAVSIVLAVAGFGARSVVLGQVALAAVTALLYLTRVRMPRLGWNRGSAKRIASTGSAISLSSLFFTAYRNIDYAILAARLPATQVGIYWRAYQFGVTYQGKVSRVLLQLALPLYARAADADEMRRLRAKITQVHAATIVPCLGFFVVVAPTVVPALFGKSWTPVVEPARILAIVGVIAALLTGTGPLMIAAGRARTLVWWNASEVLMYGVLVLAISHRGIIAVAWAAAAYGVVKAAILQFVVRRHTRISALQLWRDLLPAAVATAVSMGAAEAVVRVGHDRIPGLVAVALALVVAAPVYVGALRILFPRVGADLMLLLRQFSRARRRRDAPRIRPVDGAAPDPAA